MNVANTNTGDETTLKQRLEFIVVDMLANGDSTADQDGFFRVYQLDSTTTSAIDRIRGDFSRLRRRCFQSNCGDWHNVGGKSKFFPRPLGPPLRKRVHSSTP